MSTLRYLVIGPERLDAMRRQGTDEFGNPWKPRAAEGWGAIALLGSLVELGGSLFQPGGAADAGR